MYHILWTTLPKNLVITNPEKWHALKPNYHCLISSVNKDILETIEIWTCKKCSSSSSTFFIQKCHLTDLSQQDRKINLSINMNLLSKARPCYEFDLNIDMCLLLHHLKKIIINIFFSKIITVQVFYQCKYTIMSFCNMVIFQFCRLFLKF